MYFNGEWDILDATYGIWIVDHSNKSKGKQITFMTWNEFNISIKNIFL